MIKAIRRFIGGTVDAHIAETHDIMIRCARRCAYDLGHAIDMIHLQPGDYRRDLVEHLRAAQRHWIGLFKSGNHMKDYRLHLHHELGKRNQTIERLYALLDEHKIEDPQDDRVGF